MSVAEWKRERATQRFLPNEVSSRDECVRASLKYWWVCNEAEQTDSIRAQREEEAHGEGVWVCAGCLCGGDPWPPLAEEVPKSRGAEVTVQLHCNHVQLPDVVLMNPIRMHWGPTCSQVVRLRSVPKQEDGED